mmetsp:Transcript_99077/g.308734  ORF Transcript_99077/g.308734 Transcript_99077/m.308734 type:complete len:405 (-) Transcript_99077:71-1285(-)
MMAYFLAAGWVPAIVILFAGRAAGVSEDCHGSSCPTEHGQSIMFVQKVTRDGLMEVPEVTRDSLMEVAEADAATGYGFCSGEYNVGGYMCQTPSGSPDTKIYFPCDPQKKTFPVVAFAHGSGGRGEMDQAKDAFSKVVSQGIIIIAPYTEVWDKKKCNSKHEYKDVLRAMQVSEKDKSLHTALGSVDWSRQAFWGYSMGGKTTPRAVAKLKGDSRVKAMVVSYGARKCDEVSVPTLAVTGAHDHMSTPASVMKQQFDGIKADHKVYLNFKWGQHDEPLDGRWRRPNELIARFLACHLEPGSNECGHFYGKSREVCKAHKYEGNGCIVKGSFSANKPVKERGGGGSSRSMGSSRSRRSRRSKASCTAESVDPWVSGAYVKCCRPLKKCLGQSGSRWHYTCRKACR